MNEWDLLLTSKKPVFGAGTIFQENPDSNTFGKNYTADQVFGKLPDLGLQIPSEPPVSSSNETTQENGWNKFGDVMKKVLPALLVGYALSRPNGGGVLAGSATQAWQQAKEAERQRELQKQQIAEEQRRYQKQQDLLAEQKAYRDYRDKVEDNRYNEDNQWKQDWAADERTYNRGRDVVTDQRYEDAQAHQKEREGVEDQRYADSLAKGDEKFDWQKATDARDFNERQREFNVSSGLEAERIANRSNSGNGNLTPQEVKQQKEFIKRVDKDYTDYAKTAKPENRLGKLEWMSQHPVYKSKVRAYMAITSGGDQKYMDKTRTTYGLIHPEVASSPKLLAADKYLQSSKTGSLKSAIVKSIQEHSSRDVVEGLIERWNLNNPKEKRNINYWVNEARKQR